MTTLPVSVVIPTCDRPESLARTLGSLSAQSVVPAELIVIDGSSADASQQVVERFAAQWSSGCTVEWQSAAQLGAAAQRNQGASASTQPFIWFLDDDILFETGCVERLWSAMQSDVSLGGVNAMIVDMRYQRPGAVSRALFTLLHGRHRDSFAGLVIGPAVNLLPEDREDLPEVVPVEWLSTACTLYRRDALPTPPFDSVFTGYSLMEDLALSLRVARKWRLANARTARIVHLRESGAHKADGVALSAMELVNRHYVMTQILGRRRYTDYIRLFVWETFQLAVCAVRAESRPTVSTMWLGKLRGVSSIRNSRVRASCEKAGDCDQR